MKTTILKSLYFITGTLLILTGCDQGTEPPVVEVSGHNQVVLGTAPAEAIRSGNNNVQKPSDIQVEIGNTRYLFVLADHSMEELQALLNRADEIAQTSLDHFDDLDIALVIHGPTVEMFTEKNYQKNKELVDLAAKLDAFNVVDLKICEKSLSSRGLSKDEFPSFIESVPYAPDEIRRLTEEGYINL